MSSTDKRVAKDTTAAASRVRFEMAQDESFETGAAFARVVAGYFAATATGEGPVSTSQTPGELAARFVEPLPREGRPLADILARLERDVFPGCNRLMHPRSMGHQVSAPLPVAVWMEAVTAALNQSGAVWEMSPAGTAIEAQVIRWMADLVGYPGEAGGTFTSGGTDATFAGLLAARQAARPDAWRAGLGPTPPVVVCGEHAHYGVARAAGELGIGTANIVTVPSRAFHMDADALERTLESLRASHRAIMAVVATAGTTATGSFDDLGRIGPICDRFGTWLHVDGAHGASALLSARHRHRVAGIAHARSIAWDPHKMLLMPLTASVVLVRRERDLEEAFAQHAPYLFHGRDGGRNWDQGLRTFQCSRRIDAFKVWAALLRHGADGLGALYDRLCDTAAALHGLIARRDDFAALHEPESNILCFRYVGRGGVPDDRLDEVNLRLRAAFNRAGEGWITTTMLGGRRVLRVTLMNPRTTGADLAQVLDGLARLASHEA